jgi:C_GCAxxG_C_C family probable redox protein
VAEHKKLNQKVDELAKRAWDLKAIKARVRKMVKEGIPEKKLDPEELLRNKQEILDRVQLHAEENNFFLKNCAQSTALALMEEFGLGSMEIIKALTPFPGIGGTGRVCGGITGSLVAFGLFFGSDSPPDRVKTDRAIKTSRKFMTRFENEIGYLYCSDIIEKVILGHKLNPGESKAAMKTFTREKGFEKCGLPPGTGVRLAAEFIIDSLTQGHHVNR